MNRIEFYFNNYFRGKYKQLKVTPSLVVVWDSQYTEAVVKSIPPHYVLELWIDWIFWGAGIEIAFFIKKKKKKK